MTVALDTARETALDGMRAGRTSVKWTRYAPDVIPLSVAEMDYPVADLVERTLIERVRASDFGYIDAPGPLAGAFGDFARRRWGWEVEPGRVHVTTDVSTAIAETLRYGIRPGGGVVINPPVYTAFYELVEEAGAERIEVPLVADGDAWSIDLAATEAAFAAGADALLLCHPQNPLGLVHDPAVLDALARLAARYDVLVVSDEVHAPLTHPGTRFVPFLDVARRHGTRAVCVTSASKGWNLAGVKCALMIAGDEESARVLDALPEEVTCRTSILGLHANVAAFASTGWLDDTIAQVTANERLLSELLAEQLPLAVYHRPHAGYLGWIDLDAYGLGADPAARLVETARVALNPGHGYGSAYAGFVRINIACDPALLTDAVLRLGAALEPGVRAAS